MKKVLACDVDEVILDVLPVWLQWCNVFNGTDHTLESISYEYNLVNVFPDMDGVMDFWSTPHLYQKLKPKEGAVEALNKLHEKGWEIGFVTYCKKAHLSSKCKMLKTLFPFYSFIHPTKEKGWTRCTHFLDDRHKYLNQQLENVVAIKFKTPYTQDEELKRDVIEVESWKEIYELLEG